MREEYGNIWNMKSDVLCITTNGFVKNNGRAVMGAGIAKEAKDRIPGIDMILGQSISKHGNRVSFLFYDEIEGQDIWSFPVKHNWFEKADMELIRRSCRELMNKLPHDQTALLPRPGCGNGRLKWQDVKREIEPILDDRITVVTFSPS